MGRAGRRLAPMYRLAARLALSGLLIAFASLGLAEAVSPKGGSATEVSMPHLLAIAIEFSLGLSLLHPSTAIVGAWIAAFGFLGAWGGTVLHVGMHGDSSRCRSVGARWGLPR